MKTLINSLILALFLSLFQTSEAQILKKVKEAVKETAEDETVEESKKKTKEAMKGIFSNKKKEKEKTQEAQNKDAKATDKNKTDTEKSDTKIISGSHFFPNGNVLFYEDFDKDKQGDFPVNWETDMGAEIVSIDGSKALYIYEDSQVMLDVDPLPENAVLEFDLVTKNLEGYGDNLLIQLLSEKKFNRNRLDKTSSGASVELPTNGIKKGRNSRINFSNWGNQVSNVKNTRSINFSQYLERSAHITIVKNKNRFRFYLDNQKILDLPSFLGDEAAQYLRFKRDNLRNDKPNEITAIANIKITQESQDIRSQLLKGNLTTNQILFETGSANIQTQSEDILTKIGKVLAANKNMQYLVIGHTDNVGDADKNSKLSKERAQAVIDYLIANHGISTNQLIPVGKGETEPIASNNTVEGKKQNRRVQFKKL